MVRKNESATATPHKCHPYAYDENVVAQDMTYPVAYPVYFSAISRKLK